MASRAQPTLFSEWWRTVDRLTLAALGALMLGGIVLCLAASPPVAARIGLDPFHFVNRQVLFLIPAALVLIAASFLSPREIRRVALVVFAVSLVLTALTPYFGAEIKGARRWLAIIDVRKRNCRARSGSAALARSSLRLCARTSGSRASRRFLLAIDCS